MAMDSRRFGRTPKGHSEISQGHKSLKGKLRTVLFLVDAGKTADDIQRQVLLIGAPPDSIAQLMAAGYVAEVGQAGQTGVPAEAAASTDDRVANFRVAKAFMNETIVDALGIRAFGFTLRLERCATTEDLIAILPSYAEALLKKLDREATRALVERTRELLASARG
jgi:hypothetical protein